MNDFKINKEKLYAHEILTELEDLYISKISKNEVSREKLEPLRKCINFIRKDYNLDDKSEYLYNQYIKAIRYNIIYPEIMDQIQNENDLK